MKRIRFKLLAIALATFILVSGCLPKDCVTKQTTNQRHLRRLLKTNRCPNCNLGDANTTNADFRGAIYRKAEALEKEYGDTVFPDGFDPVQAGMFEDEIKHPIDLNKVNIREANLKGKFLYDEKFDGLDFSGLDLSETELRKVSFVGADLSNTNFSKVRFTGSITLEKANLSGANLSYANFRHSSANLKQANLSNAKLIGTNLSKVNLKEANLEQADLRKSSLFRTNLREANLKQADLRESNLNSTDLRGANLLGAKLPDYDKNRYLLPNLEGAIMPDKEIYREKK